MTSLKKYDNLVQDIAIIDTGIAPTMTVVNRIACKTYVF